MIVPLVSSSSLWGRIEKEPRKPDIGPSVTSEMDFLEDYYTKRKLNESGNLLGWKGIFIHQEKKHAYRFSFGASIFALHLRNDNHSSKI